MLEPRAFTEILTDLDTARRELHHLELLLGTGTLLGAWENVHNARGRCRTLTRTIRHLETELDNAVTAEAKADGNAHLLHEAAAFLGDINLAVTLHAVYGPDLTAQLATALAAPEPDSCCPDETCHRCTRWVERIRWSTTNTVPGEPDVTIARVDGWHYFINPAAHDLDRRLLGCNGKEFTFHFTDGRTLTSNDVWSEGEIPARFRDRLPDNAVIVDPRPTFRSTAPANWDTPF